MKMKMMQIVASALLILSLTGVTARHAPYSRSEEAFVCPNGEHFCECLASATHYYLDMLITEEEGTIFTNGVSPSPTLIVVEGQVLKFHVTNNLNTATSIHWHGMFQRITSFMDGVGMLSHRSIPAGTTFDYVFEATPSGTHWYHSHTSTQRTEGMFGALVVKDAVMPAIMPEMYSQALVNSPPQGYTILLSDFPLNYTQSQFNVQQGSKTYFRLVGAMA